MGCDLRSDNVLGCSPEITEAVARAAAGTETSYGGDEYTKRVREMLSDIFEIDVEIFPVITGSAANALAISALTSPWGAVFCHEDAHIQRDECGGPEFFSGGAKLIPIAGAEGKLHPDDLRARIHEIAISKRTAVPACLSITNVTEAGTVYTPDEVSALREVAKGLGAHMDGARFANAVIATAAAPADLTWRAGIDILSLGATKNGAMLAEVIVVFKKELANDMAMRHHRSGHRPSKMRFISAQLEAYFSNDLWLRNASHANAMGERLASGLREAGVEIVQRTDANVVFARFGRELADELERQGFLFGDWPIFGPDVYRMVTGFNTSPHDIDAVIAAVILSRGDGEGSQNAKVVASRDPSLRSG
jgi:threonine aldolase